MPNDQPFIVWLWNADLVLFVLWAVCQLAVIGFIVWFCLRIKKATPPPTPRIVDVLMVFGAVLGAVAGCWVLHVVMPAPIEGWTKFIGVTITIIVTAALGGGIGQSVGEFVSAPRTALCGARFGMLGFLLFASVELYLSLKHEQNLWAAERWISRATMVVLFTWLAAFFVCVLERYPPSRLAEQRIDE